MVTCETSAMKSSAEIGFGDSLFEEDFHGPFQWIPGRDYM